MNTRWLAGALAMALAGSGGCGKSRPMYRAVVNVVFAADVSNPLPMEEHSSTNWFEDQVRLVESDPVLSRVIEELGLEERWSVPRGAAIQRLREALFVAPIQASADSRRIVEDTASAGTPVGFSLSVTMDDESACELVAEGVSRAFKRRAEELAAVHFTEQLEQAERELQATQDKLAAIDRQIQRLQTNLFVPSGYRLSKDYEAELQARISEAENEEAGRKAQLESLRRLSAGELRTALLKIETERLALPEVATSPTASTSMLLTTHQAQKLAADELERARAGGTADTNALAHAQLRLDEADRNLADTMGAYLKSLEIEWEVSRTRTQELAASLEKLRETARRAGEKAAFEAEANGLVASAARLSAEIERWKLAQRIVGETIHVGEVTVARLASR